LGGLTSAPGSRDDTFGLADHCAGDAQQPLVEALHLRLAPRADRRGRPLAGRPTALGDLEDPARHATRALADAFAKSPHPPGQYSDAVRQQCGVGRVVNVRFDDRGIDAKAPAAHHAPLVPHRDQSREQVLEHGFVEQAR